MLIRIGYDVVFDLPAPTPMLLMLSVHPSRFGSLRGPEQLSIEPFVPTVWTDEMPEENARKIGVSSQ